MGSIFQKRPARAGSNSLHEPIAQTAKVDLRIADVVSSCPLPNTELGNTAKKVIGGSASVEMLRAVKA